MPDDRGERIENSTSATLGVHLTYGLTMASYRPHIWSGANYPVFTIYKGRTTTTIKDFLQGFRWFLTLFNWYACIFSTIGSWLNYQDVNFSISTTSGSNITSKLAY
ncbi:hypothetical protein AAG906_039127 [Vitis piasezkii]